jgi:nitroreductase
MTSSTNDIFEAGLMEFDKVLEKRHSIRAFQHKDVPKEKLDRIIKAVLSCPTAGNLQSYRVWVVKDKKHKIAVSEAAFGQTFVADASVVLVFCACPANSSGKYGSRGRELYSTQDATIATAFAHLTAVAEGLGSCWVGAFEPEAVTKALDLPENLIPVSILPLGIPVREGTKTERKPLKEMVTFVE